MSPLTSPPRKLSNSQIAIAAESFAAAQFALCGFDVLEQAGRARFFYDLGVATSGGMMKVSIHASFNGFWDLADRYLESSQRRALSAIDYHHAIDQWMEHRSSRVMCCLVEFESAGLDRMPRIYLASAPEVAAAMHRKIDQLACQDLVDLGVDVVHRMQDLPSSWRFSLGRIAELMDSPAEVAILPSSSADVELAEAETVAWAPSLQQPMVN